MEKSLAGNAVQEYNDFNGNGSNGGMKDLGKRLVSSLARIVTPEVGLNVTRMFYSIGLIFCTLHLLFYGLFKDVYHADRRQALYKSALEESCLFSSLAEGWSVFIVPALLMALLFALLFLAMKGWKKRDLMPYLCKSFIITIIFSFLTFKLAHFTGDLRIGDAGFTDTGHVRIFIFMLIYAVPVSVSVIANRGDRRMFLRDGAVYLLLVILSGVPAMLQQGFSPVPLLFSLYNLGLFYFIATLVSLLSIFDSLVAGMDEGIAATLLYFFLPPMILASYFLIGLLVVYGGLTRLMGSAGGMEVYVPFEHAYFYLKGIIYYDGPAGLVSGILGIAAISSAAMTLYVRGRGSEDSFGFLNVMRSLLGLAGFSWFLVRPLPLQWYVSTPILTAIIAGLFVFCLKHLSRA